MFLESAVKLFDMGYVSRHSGHPVQCARWPSHSWLFRDRDGVWHISTFYFEYFSICIAFVVASSATSSVISFFLDANTREN